MAEPGPIIRSGGRVSSVCGGIRAIKNCKIDKAFKCPFQACATTDKKPARVLQHVQKVHMGDVVIEHPSQVYDYLNSKLRNPVIEKVFVQRLKWVDGTGSNKLFPVTVPSQFDILLTSTRKAKKNDSDQRLPGAPDDVRYDENGPGGDPVFQNEAIMRSIKKLAAIKYKVLVPNLFTNVSLYQDILKSIISLWFLKNAHYAKRNSDHLERSKIDFRTVIGEDSLIGYSNMTSELIIFGIMTCCMDKLSYCGPDELQEEDIEALRTLYVVKSETKVLFARLLNLLEDLVRNENALKNIIMSKDDLKLVLQKSRLITNEETKTKYNYLVKKINLSLTQTMPVCDIIGEILKNETTTAIQLDDTIFGVEADLNDDDDVPEEREGDDDDCKCTFSLTFCPIFSNKRNKLMKKKKKKKILWIPTYILKKLNA